MSDLCITAGPLEFGADWVEAAPRTCAVFAGMLPFVNKIIHVRWSGESAWIPLGDLQTNLGFENHTSHPAPGELLLYPGGYSETEILFPYGGTCFASIVGQLAGNSGRLAGQKGVGQMALLKTGLTVAALGVTAYSRVLGRRVSEQTHVPAQSGTAPAATTPKHVAQAQQQLRALQWAVPALTGALVAVSSFAGEQQRPSSVTEGITARLTRR